MKSEIVRFLEEYAEDADARGYVLGLSGGVDSAVTAALATEAVGEDSVKAFWLPCRPTNDTDDRKDAEMMADSLGIQLVTVPIGPMLSSFHERLPILENDKVTRGNLQARLRMCVLYAEANYGGWLVAGTGNRSELLTGYFTKHGDGAADVLPLGHVYKTGVYGLAEELDVPERIINKKPSAGLWKGQTDEEELGLDYETLDKVLKRLPIMDSSIISEQTGVSLKDVYRVRELFQGSEHKRELPPAPRVNG